MKKYMKVNLPENVTTSATKRIVPWRNIAYRHSDLNREANSDDHTNKDNNDDDENMWECQVCDFKAVLYNDYWEHIDNNHLEDADA